MRYLSIAAIVLFIDQVTKVIVVKTMYRGQSIPLLGDWLQFTFTQNPGMAFGITVGPAGMVTIFSIIATFLIIIYMLRVRHINSAYTSSLAFILGGAVGNIIDRVFYGKILGYGDFFRGEVVDFIHVNVWNGYISESVPLIGGNYMALFPIWNVADMAIVSGVIGILVFQKAFHHRLSELQEKLEAEKAGEDQRDGVPEAASPTSEATAGTPKAPPAPEEASAVSTIESPAASTPDTNGLEEAAQASTPKAPPAPADLESAAEKSSEEDTP